MEIFGLECLPSSDVYLKVLDIVNKKNEGKTTI